MSKILIIEDSPEMRENISEILELSGYEVFEASNGLEGLAAARKEFPDLILCDVMMPEMDGYAVLRALENFPVLNQVPFVFLTAKAEKGDFRMGMDLGADDYLTKPFNADDLLRVVMARLKKSRNHRSEDQARIANLEEYMNGTSGAVDPDLLPDKRILKKMKRKETVYMEGDSVGYLYFIISGKVKTYRTNEWGKEYITGIYNPGEFFGYHAFFDGSHARDESAAAMEEAEFAMLNRENFQQLLATNREVALQFTRFMSNTLGEAEQRLLRLAYDSARKRVAESLLFIYRKYNAQEGSPIPMSRENIATLAGISPESASRNLSDFKEEGLIGTENGAIRILNLQKLETLRA